MTDRTPPGDDAVAAGYAEALAELEEILARLDRTDVDVDVLAAQVSRAAVLIAFCRERIGLARAQIDGVLGDLPDSAS